MKGGDSMGEAVGLESESVEATSANDPAGGPNTQSGASQDGNYEGNY